jgi:hypothetical protein
MDLIDDRLMFFFCDIGCAAPGVNFKVQSMAKDLSRVLFYWSRECPFIPVKQAHAIKTVIEQNDDIRELITGPGQYNTKLKESDLIKSIIYPSWDRRIYQKKVKHDDDHVISYFGNTAPMEALDKFVNQSFLNRRNDIRTRRNKHLVGSRYYDVGLVKHQVL